MQNPDERYPEGHEGVIGTWPEEGFTVTVLKAHITFLQPHLNGYVRFPKRPVKEEGYKGILTYVPVHGGITYAEPDEDGSMVYGFDCAHAGDDTDPKCQDASWVRAEALRMGRAILVAKEYEKRYLRNVSQKGKATVLDEYRDKCRELGLVTDSAHMAFGVIINLLAGRLW